MKTPQVILVDPLDNEIGSMEKLKAHELGLRHRAISVIVTNSKGEILLQKRALSKYHSPGLWTNTCCSHPYPGENTLDAAKRRLVEEMGIDTTLDYLFQFEYRTKFDNGLIEHELDHVFLCHTDQEPSIDLNEATDWKYMSLDDIITDMANQPESYTHWFKIIVERLNPVLKPF